MQLVRTSLQRAFSDFAFNGGGILVGPPGVGKTYLLHSFCEKLLREKKPCLYLPVDKLGVETEAALLAELGSNAGNLLAFLRGQHPGENVKGVLIIDAFDAARSDTARQLFLSLIRQVTSQLAETWHVVVSVRTYDARKSQALLDLFPQGTPLEQDYQLTDVSARHFRVPELTDAEVVDTIRTIEHLPEIYKQGSCDFKRLLKIPFNLWLTERLLASRADIPGLSSVRSEVELLGLFWRYRILEGSLGPDREAVLHRVTGLMVEKKTLSVLKQEVYEVGAGQAWESLLSSEILFLPHSVSQRISFSHNILFDYAVSVLLIEDNSERLIEFVGADASRPLFLRPSLNYYFTRLWQEKADTFWDVFWSILSSTVLHIRLFARIVPTSVIVTEAREIHQLWPLVQRLSSQDLLSVEAALRVFQALRALQIRNDRLWSEFLKQVSDNLHRDFAWDFAMIAADILESALRNSDDESHKNCGYAGRNLLTWIWQCRGNNQEPALDRLGGTWGVRLVARTFSTDSDASRLLIQNILGVVQEPNFPIDYIYWLADELHHIWPHDPGLAEQVYKTIFGHRETSQEATGMGTPVMPMSSNRRQDYEGAWYILVRHFPKFLRAAPLSGGQALVHCINDFVMADHVQRYLKKKVTLESLIQRFPFRGRTAQFVPDGSYIWDESLHQDKPLEMANSFFTFLGELATSTEQHGTLEALLDLMRDQVIVAFFWRRLLETASKHPSVFYNRIFELAVAHPIQSSAETVHELGVFLETCSSHFTEEQLSLIEQSILDLGHTSGGKERRFVQSMKGRLLSCLPREKLGTSASALLEEMQRSGKITTNKPLVSFHMSSEPYTEEKWLHEEGIDPERVGNRELRTLYGQLQEFRSKWENEIPDLTAIQEIFPVAETLHTKASATDAADALVVTTAWSSLGACARLMCRTLKRPEGPEFTFCHSVLLFCARHAEPQPRTTDEEHFKSPGWSSNPRNEAAQGLPWLALISPNTEVLQAIESLARDPVPSVRYLTTLELFRLNKKAPEFFWRMAALVASKEPNNVVINALCHSLSRVLLTNEEKATEVLKIILERSLDQTDEGDLLDSLVTLLVGLALVRENKWAVGVIDNFLLHPVKRAAFLRRATFTVLSYVEPEDFSNPEEAVTADRGLVWIQKLIDAAARGIGQLRDKGQLSTKEQAQFRDAYGVVDEVVTRFYFKLCHREGKPKRGEYPLTEEQRRIFYEKVKPLLSKIIAFSLDEKVGLLLAPTAHRFMELLNGVLRVDPRGVLRMAALVARASEKANYNLDGLAIREVVKLVEAILADYRTEVREGESLQDLLTLLDIFAEAGWPDALRLVWRLDEIFRQS